MADKRANLVDWLRDAHAMEQQPEQMLSAQKSRLENYPKLRTRIEKQMHKACEQILPQEIAMAEWLKEHLPELTQAFLDRSETPGLEAKR